jgi:hypothetical protein
MTLLTQQRQFPGPRSSEFLSKWPTPEMWVMTRAKARGLSALFGKIPLFEATVRDEAAVRAGRSSGGEAAQEEERRSENGSTECGH